MFPFAFYKYRFINIDFLSIDCDLKSYSESHTTPANKDQLLLELVAVLSATP